MSDPKIRTEAARAYPRKVVALTNVVIVSDHHGSAWTLHRRDDGRVLADLVVTGGDFPWLNARVDQREGLAEVRPLFAEELRLLDAGDLDVESWERAYEAIRIAVTLRSPEGHDS
ncbi:hypothetical protein AB0L86_26280 [Micromonospora musae]|uniref:hypothetical protein n=1 Tax=Micromonospora musae TaxID=1894970 RepID=UPI0034423B88